MSKNFLILNALVALTLMACNPAIPKRKGDPSPSPSPSPTKAADNADESVAKEEDLIKVTAVGSEMKRVKTQISLLEITRSEDSPLHFKLEIKPEVKEDSATKVKKARFVVAIKEYGPNNEPSDAVMSMPSTDKLYPTMEAIFAGKKALIHKPIEAGVMGAGSLSARVIPSLDVNRKLVVNEPIVEGDENYIRNLIPMVHEFMKKKQEAEKKEQKKDEKKDDKKAEVVTVDTSKDASACAGLDLSGAWRYSLDSGSTDTIEVVSTMALKSSANGIIQYDSKDVKSVQGCFGPVSKTESSSLVSYDNKSCILINQDSGGRAGSYAILKVSRLKAEKAGEKGALTGLEIQACKDAACKAPLEGAQVLELKLEAALK